MKRIVKPFLLTISTIFLLLIIIYIFFSIKWKLDSEKNFDLLGDKAPIINVGGNSLRDLNKNGRLDPYENPNNTIEERVEDLVNQMTIEEKAGSLFINMIGVNADGSLMEVPNLFNPFSFLMGASSEKLILKKMNHFNIRASHSKENMLKWHNKIQEIGERSRLGIPITIASDPRHGVPNTFGASIFTPYFSKWPSALGLGATQDSLLVYEHAKIVKEEYKAIGIRVALGPMADISTEPRWIRVDGTFGEDFLINSKLTAAYVKGIQGDSIGINSVASMVKHFPGAGTPLDGNDTHFPPGIQTYPGGEFDKHLKPFEAAFNAGVSSVMPYYSIPKGITSEDVGAGYNKEIISGLLREKYNFQGIICTDWATITDLKPLGIIFKPASAHGVEHLNTDQRLKKLFNAGIDMIGGESLSNELSELIKKGEISLTRINESVKRIMKQKFQLGLFDNPYLDLKVLSVFNNQENLNKGIEAQKKSLVLLKNNQKLLPLKKEAKVYFHGFDFYPNSLFQSYSLENADIIIAKVKSPNYGKDSEYLMEKMIGGGDLDFLESDVNQMIKLFKSKPTVIVLNLKRPAIISKIEPYSEAIIADFDVDEKIILELIYGEFLPTGKLPIQLPSSMKSVLEQDEDVPFDLKNPLYDYGHGLSF